MEIQGKIWKSKKFWFVEVPSLDVMTQGKTRKEAILMIQDLIQEMAYSYLHVDCNSFALSVIEYGKRVIGISSTNSMVIVSLVLKRQRELSQTTIREASQRLGSKSPNAYAQYETGKINVSIDKWEQILHAANPHTHSVIRLV